MVFAVSQIDFEVLERLLGARRVQLKNSPSRLAFEMHVSNSRRFSVSGISLTLFLSTDRRISFPRACPRRGSLVSSTAAAAVVGMVVAAARMSLGMSRLLSPRARALGAGSWPAPTSHTSDARGASRHRGGGERRHGRLGEIARGCTGASDKDSKTDGASEPRHFRALANSKCLLFLFLFSFSFEN